VCVCVCVCVFIRGGRVGGWVLMGGDIYICVCVYVPAQPPVRVSV
jgi:hypothetical protein